MTEAQSISAKYIFFDIVSYSHGRSAGGDDYRFITLEGREKLKAEWPPIWKEFGFLSTL